jgi:hypothetical protein
MKLIPIGKPKNRSGNTYSRSRIASNHSGKGKYDSRITFFMAGRYQFAAGTGKVAAG